MPALLIAASFLATIAIVGLLDPVQLGRWRRSFLKAAILHGVTIVLLTELLSTMRALTSTAIVGFWAVGAIVTLSSLMVLWRRRSQHHLLIENSFLRDWQILPLPERLVIVAVATTLLITVITALLAAPNNWDAMVYHMPRVMHWIQNQTVAHYPSSEVRQLAFMPGAGYVVMQLQLLAGGDRLANLPQGLAFLGCILGTSLMAEQVSGQRTAWIAALVCASVPMAIMQATTPQTDLLTAFWLVCLTYFVWGCQPSHPDHSPLPAGEGQGVGAILALHQDKFWIAASLSLGIVTKPTAWIFSLPILVVLGLRLTGQHWRSHPPVMALARAGLLTTGVGLASLIPALPSFWRNIQTFGSFSGGDYGTATERLGTVTIASNLLKNLALNLPIPGFWQVVQALHIHWLHIDLDDSALSLNLSPLTATDSSPTEALIKVLAPHEDFVGYPVHLLLFVMAAIALIWQCLLFWLRNPQPNPPKSLLGSDPPKSPLKRGTSNQSGSVPTLLRGARGDQMFRGGIGALATIVVLDFLLVCLLLKWQPWGNRLMLPIAILAAPVIADYVAQWQQPWRRLLLSGLAAMAIVYALTPMRHPLIALPFPSAEQSPSILTLTRSQMYFSGARKQLAAPYQQAAATIQQMGCTSIGFVLGAEAWEYPLWVLLQKASPQPIHIQHLRVNNPSQKWLSASPPIQHCVGITVDGDRVSTYSNLGWTRSP